MDGVLRLQDAANVNERHGTLEICFNATYGTICDDTWGHQDASVACANLGFSRSGKCAIYYNI